MFAVPWIPKERIESCALNLIHMFNEVEHANVLVEAKGIDSTSYLELLVAEEKVTTYYMADLGADVLGRFNFLDSSLPDGGNTIVLSQELTEGHPQRSFTVAHEIGHLQLHYPLYVFHKKQRDLFSDDNRNGIACQRKILEWQFIEPEDQPLARLEWQANYYAACLLLPASSVLKRCQAFMRAEPHHERDALIRYLAETFFCSKQCVKFRLRELDIR